MQDGLHVVKEGDSLADVAAAHNLSLADLRRINRLSSDQLFAGQVLVVDEGLLPGDVPRRTPKGAPQTMDVAMRPAASTPVPVRTPRRLDVFADDLSLLGDEAENDDDKDKVKGFVAKLAPPNPLPNRLPP